MRQLLLHVSLLLLASFAYAADRYIVVMRQNTPMSVVDELITSLIGLVLNPLQRFNANTFRGFSAQLSPEQLVLLHMNSNVAYVEKDSVVSTLGVPSLHQKRTTTTQSSGTWGLGRLSHKTKGDSSYVYDSSAGQGTCVYVIDSGIYTSHNDFEGRAFFLQNWVNESNDDLCGHGTAVAGTIGSKTYGVAKKTTLYSLKVCDQNGNCNVSDLVSALSFAVNDQQNRNCPNGVVVNLSLGGLSAGWQSVKDVVVAATKAGIFVVAAAGNDHANAQNYSPSSAAGACSVGATDCNDAIAQFSNWGSTVAVFAPGVSVKSTYIGSPDATTYFDGTSMAAPHVAGLGAYLNAKNGRQSPVGLCTSIKNSASANTISGLGGLSGTPNKLAYNGAA